MIWSVLHALLVVMDFCIMRRQESVLVNRKGDGREVFRPGLGVSQQAKRDTEGGEAVNRISEKDILFYCLPDL